MSQKTVSELLFEKICNQHDIALEEVSSSSVPSNDYNIFPQSQKIVCEVKQIDANKNELAWERGEVSRLSPWPGNRVRDRIKDAAPQLKTRAEGRFPSLLVIYNNVWYRLYGDDWEVLTAMYGQETTVINVPDDPQYEPFINNVVFGGNRSMTPQHNTSISAVAVLRQQNDKHTLYIYYNVHAAIPLNPDLLRYPAIRHFTIDLQPGSAYSEWREI